MAESSDRQKPVKDVWDKLQVTMIAGSAVAVPLVIAVFGNSYSASVKEKEIRLKTVEMAIGVLSQDPKVNASLPQLRQWAVTVIDNYSGVPLTPSAREELLKNALPTRDTAKVVDILTSSFGGLGAGFFVEATVDNYKFYHRDFDLTENVKRGSARLPLVGREGTQTFSVLVGDKKFEINVPIRAGMLTKIVIGKDAVYTEGPAEPGAFLTK